MTRIARTPQPAPDRQVSMSARVIKRADYSTSKQSDATNEFELLASTMMSSNVPLMPPHDVENLFDMIGQSSMLPQCLDAYVTNTVDAGWEIAPIARGVEMDPDEVDELQSFLDRANIDESLVTVVGKQLRDREAVGFGFTEVIRDRSKRISILRNAPSISMRLTGKHPDEQRVKYDIRRGKRVVVMSEFKKFRKYVQIISGVVIYFREFGDPREMNSVTGLYEGETGYTADSPATEIWQWKLPSNCPYGVPRWIAQTPAMIGSREAEEVNMRFFEDNTIPPVMITVAGGRLTNTSYQEMVKVINSGVGKERQNKMILLEAVGEGEAIGDKASTIQIKVDKLTSERPSDGLFKEYKEGNQADMRSAFRLPPISVGMSQDANFATANVSQFVAETQVFAPARTKIDEMLNISMVNSRNGLNLKTVKLVSRTPTISSPDATMKALTALNVIGAVTPRTAQMVANTMLQIELPPYPEKGEEGYEAWMDQPMAITIKEAAAKAGTGDPSAQNSHDGQAAKDAATKATEADGDIGTKAPEHGSE
jgi:PBSX family phage portal protein